MPSYVRLFQFLRLLLTSSAQYREEECVFLHFVTRQPSVD